MPLWARYDRANGRIVAITTAPVAPPAEGPIGIIECNEATRVGDFIGDPEGAPDDPFTDPQPKE
jgi:hypothetical protein